MELDVVVALAFGLGLVGGLRLPLLMRLDLVWLRPSDLLLLRHGAPFRGTDLVTS